MTATSHDKTDGAELYVSVDVEASGPIPGEYSMLSLGACLVDNLDLTFYREFRPLSDRAVPEALAVSKLSMELLSIKGCEPAEAMSAFRDWLMAMARGRRCVCVGFNASFDWQFVNWYFHRFVGKNPFGIGALDIKPYYMGLIGCSWEDTRSGRLLPEFRPSERLTHNALDDAVVQGKIFAKLLAASVRRY